MERLRLRLELGRDGFAPLAAFIGLAIELLRLGCRAAFVGQCQHFDNILFLPGEDAQHISHCHRFGRLDARFVELHLAAFNSIRRQSACFEEPRGTKPLVQTKFLGVIFGSHNKKFHIFPRQIIICARSVLPELRLMQLQECTANLPHGLPYISC